MRYSLVAICLILCVPGCAGGDSGGPGTVTDTPRLQATSDSAIGLGYGGLAPLSLRYVDGAGNPVARIKIRYALGGQTGGATLSSDTVITSDDGRASVDLTAGSSEASFHVTASASGAADLVFEVAVSRFPFVALDARLAYTGAGMGTVATLEALLYDDRPCAHLAPEPPIPTPLRTASAPGASATLHFPQLRTLGYALAGRAVDKTGRLLAWGCVDLTAAQFAGADALSVPVPLAPVSPSVAGAFRLTATVPVGPGQLPAWDALAACAASLPAQPLLDAIVTALGPGPDAEAISAHRGPADNKGCRPVAQNGTRTLDGALRTLLAKPNSPTLLLPAAVADLDAIASTFTLSTRLDLAPTGEEGDPAARYLGLATVERITVSGDGGAHPTSYDPGALGFPITTAGEVPVTAAAGVLHIAKHGFTVRLAALWGRAAADIAFAPRGLPTDARALLGAVVAAATRQSGDRQLTGCDAIDDLVSQTTGRASGPVASACTQALDALAAELTAGFIAPGGIDFNLSGTATLVDADANLVAESLTGGLWTGGVLVPPMKWQPLSAPFTGTRIP